MLYLYEIIFFICNFDSKLIKPIHPLAKVWWFCWLNNYKLYGKFVWVTDMCLKDGKIRKVKARIEDCGGLLLADTPGRYTPYQIGDCAFESKEEALKHAEGQRTDLIKSLKLQIHELENLKFKCDD